MSERLVIVKDQAVLRYLERRQDVDVEAVRAAIAAVCRRGAEAGADSVLHDGLRYVLRHDPFETAVVTTLIKSRSWVAR